MQMPYSYVNISLIFYKNETNCSTKSAWNIAFPEKHEPVLVIQILYGMYIDEINGAIYVLCSGCKGLIYLDDSITSGPQKLKRPFCYRPIEYQRIFIGYKKSEVRFMIKDIRSHQSLF